MDWGIEGRAEPRTARRALLLLTALAAGGALAVPVRAIEEGSRPVIGIDVLSNRADLISGGDALVALRIPGGVDASTVRVTVNDGDVTPLFAARPNGRYAGVLTGLPDGANVVVARGDGATAGTITITSHPIGGPVFSGPQLQPWVCENDHPIDDQCNQATEFEFKYLPAGVVDPGLSVAGVGTASVFLPYNLANPPPSALIAKTTTDQGVRVPYIIRVETGYLDRDEYRIATLFDPAKPWEPWAPQPHWNRKLVITHGASCGVDHTTGEAPGVEYDAALSRGFMVMSTAADNAGHNCSVVMQAESLMMAKEHLVESYGEIRYTIGTGCSGGSLTQQQVANAYPGIYQGILPQCSFPDAWSTGQQLEDYVLIRRYVENPTKWGLGVVWTPLELAAIEAHPNHANSIELSTLYGPLPDPAAACAGVEPDERWSPARPTGVRCSFQDYMVNVFGRRPQDGYAGRPYDNVGVQYGLQALLARQITPAQFADLNAKAGAHDINYAWQPGRVAADRPALAHAYRSGAINVTNNMRDVAIIDLRGPDPGAFHDAYRAFTVRARLDRENGTHDNHVIWEGFAPIAGDARYTTTGLVAMDRWLTAVEADRRAIPLARKVIEARPADVHDQCSDGLGHVFPGKLPCQVVVQLYGTPRMAAGQPITTDSVMCQRKPLLRSDYYPIEFTYPQWQQLEQAFPDGVCDYTKPGVDQQQTVAWQTYDGGPGTGHALGPAPVSSAVNSP